MPVSVRVAIEMKPAVVETLERMGHSAPPPPEAVVLWYHARIHMRVCRALVARERQARGLRVTPDDALGSAKFVLVAIERSRRALQPLRTPANHDKITRAIALLNDLERGLDERFADARSFVRVGLDVPAAPI
jgi:hypothetical protein